MLKHEKIINRLTPAQRIKLVLSGQNLKRSCIDEFEFKTISAEKNPFLARSGYFTFFPQFKALTSTWNSQLIKTAGKYSAIENNSSVGAKLFDLTDNQLVDNGYLNGQFVYSFAEGVKQGGGISVVAFDSSEAYKDNLAKVSTFDYSSKASPDVVLVNSLSDIEYMTKHGFDFEKIIFANAKDKNSAVALMEGGASVVFVPENDYEEIYEYACLAYNTYQKAVFDLNNGSIDQAQFNAMKLKGFVISDESLNKACDNIIEILCKIDDAQKDGVVEPLIKFYAKEHKVSFDEFAHNEFTYEAAKQSVILLKNRGALPLNRNDKVAVIGDYVKNDNYTKEFAGRSEIIYDPVFERINDYEEINAIGFVHGYLKDVPVNDELILKAKRLASESDSVLVFLAPEKGEKVLPESQIKLLESLSAVGRKIIAVIVAEDFIEMPFSNLCSAVLFAYNGGQNVNRAILDIISGRISPSGKVIEVLKNDESNVSSLYPFGHGLSYTSFKYSDFKVNSNGVSLVVENVGPVDGYETVQIYVSKKGSKLGFENKQLRGFAKVFVEKGKKVKVEIAFDDNTFKLYDNERGCFFIEGGSYRISAGDSSVSEKCASVIKVRGYSDKVLFKNVLTAEESGKKADREVGRFANSTKNQKVIQNGADMSTSSKIGLCIFFILYFNVVSGILLFSRARTLVTLLDMTNLIILGADLLITFVSLICIITFAARRKKKKFIPYGFVNDTLTQVIERSKFFEEEAKITYKEYVEPVEEVVETEEQVEEVVEEETVEEDFNFNVEHEAVETVNAVSIHDIYTKYTEFLLSKGLVLEPFAIRTLISAIFTSNVIFLNGVDKAKIREVILATQEFFACDREICEVSYGVESIKDLLVDRTTGGTDISSFGRNLYKASMNDKFNLLALSSVSMSNALTYLRDFVIFADNRSIERTISLNNYNVQLKKNLILLLIPEESNFTEIMPELLARNSVSINLFVRESTDSNVYNYEIEPLSYSNVEEHIEETKNSIFLPEELWKKFDAMEDLLNEKEGFVLGNKITIFGERFTSVFMECHGEDYQATDALISCKLLPVLKGLQLYKNVSGDHDLELLLEKIFEKDNVEKALRNVKKVQAVVETETVVSEEAVTVIEEENNEEQVVMEETVAETESKEETVSDEENK